LEAKKKYIIISFRRRRFSTKLTS